MKTKDEKITEAKNAIAHLPSLKIIGFNEETNVFVVEKTNDTHCSRIDVSGEMLIDVPDLIEQRLNGVLELALAHSISGRSGRRGKVEDF